MSLKPKIDRPVFICGMMGSGKTTVGKILAAELGLSFTDLDDLIEINEKMTIPDIFAQKGENYFRQAEQHAINEVTSRSSGVIALGGGALQNQKITDQIKINGLLIFLNAPLSVLLDRLKKDSGRPLLQLTDEITIRNKIKKLLEERTPLYNQSHITIHTNTRSPEQISELIIHKLRKYES